MFKRSELITNQSVKFVGFNGIGVSIAEGAIKVSVIFTGEHRFFGESVLLTDFMENVGGTGEGVWDNDVKLLDESNFFNVKDPLKLVLKNWAFKFATHMAVANVKTWKNYWDTLYYN